MKKPRLLSIAVLVLSTACVVLFLSWESGWLSTHYYRFSANASSTLNLSAYQVSIEGKVIEGIHSNASGLTFHPQRKTLFTVINGPPQVAELSLDGELLRLLPVRGLSDVEAIAHIAGDNFVIADEASHQLISIEIASDAREIDVRGKPRIALALGQDENAGIEGASWDSNKQLLLIVKEKDPLRIFQIAAFREALVQGSSEQLTISAWNEPTPLRFFLRDLSSLSILEKSDHMLLLSDESHLVVEFDEAGEVADVLVLRRGWHGLKQTVPQAEGIALSTTQQLFIISEPNLFYRFEDPQRR